MICLPHSPSLPKKELSIPPLQPDKSTVVRQNSFPPHIKSVERVSSSSRENISSRIGFRDSRRSSSQRLRLRLNRGAPACLFHSATAEVLRFSISIYLSECGIYLLCKMCFATFLANFVFKKNHRKHRLGQRTLISNIGRIFFELHPFWLRFYFLRSMIIQCAAFL